jgi:hypothetical protein
LLRALSIRLYRQEEHALAFVTGAACLNLLIFVLCAIGAARKSVFLAAGLGILGFAFRRGAHRLQGKSLPPIQPIFKWLFRSIFALFFVLYFFNAMVPETSPDGATYHLGLVSRYLRAHGFERITTSMFAALSQGIEMLFLFAFAFGRHSAAALVHFAFLAALPLAMLSYARRFGFPVAGVCGSLLVFASPAVGLDGTTAYNDVAAACIVFTVFYLAQIWAAEEANRALLVPLGLAAGFAYAAKYTAFLAVPYALAVVGWKSIRRGEPVLKPLAIVAGCVALMIAPWMVKNAVWLDNPVAPFLNSVFPNPHFHISFETEYTRQMRHYGALENYADIPLEVTVRGGTLGGLLGPVFLLAPAGLLALRSPAGRNLLSAALIFGIPYAANIETRFLIMPLPFVALSMGLAAAGWNPAALALTLAHAVLSWPLALSYYCSPRAPRMASDIPVREALRIESEESYLNARMPSYGVARMIDNLTPPGATVLTISGAPDAYTSRVILVTWESAFGELIRDILWTPLSAPSEPRRRLRFAYPAQPLRQLRVVQTAAGSSGQWSVSEFHIFRGAAELARAPDWKLRARPNPWDVQLAFDNSPITRWRSWQQLYPGMYIAVEFGKPEISDSVLLEGPFEWAVRLRLEGMDPAGSWKMLAGAPEESVGLLPSGLRRAAVEEVKTRGIEYFLVYDTDWFAEDYKTKSKLWGFNLLGEYKGARLYRLE